MTEPNAQNFCGGNFQDWIEVNLIEKCNGKCSWCIEKTGWHPKERASWETITEKIIETEKTNVILLGGEPTLYNDIDKIIQRLVPLNKKVWVTTNGSMLSQKYINEKLNGIHGINISIHDFNLEKNKEITGIQFKEGLKDIVAVLHQLDITVRFNCNILSGHIDSKEKIKKYIEFAHINGANSVRFAELKDDSDNFVDLAKMFNHEYGLNDDPFIMGCNKNATVFGIPVSFRQMCGLQTTCRAAPKNPVQYSKKVVYYDGKIYNGWQTTGKEEVTMANKIVKDILRNLKQGKINENEAEDAIKQLLEDALSDEEYQKMFQRTTVNDIGGCQY